MDPLLGPAELPFLCRFNLTCGRRIVVIAYIGLASLLLVWLRFPTGSALAHLFMGIQAAVFAAELLWRRRGLREPGGGSYARWREALAAALRLNGALLGSRCLVSKPP